MRKADALIVRNKWGGFWMFGPDDVDGAERRQWKQSDEYGNVPELMPLYALSPDEFIVTREQLERWVRYHSWGSFQEVEREVALLTGSTGRPQEPCVRDAGPTAFAGRKTRRE